MNWIKPAFWMVLIIAVALIGFGAKGMQGHIFWLFPVLFIPIGLWAARQIDKAKAYKASQSQETRPLE